jgi:phage I-like protein
MTDTNKREGKYNFVQSGGSSSATGTKKPDAKPEDELTKEEMIAASRFGMTPAEYAEQKGKLRYA